MAIGIERDCYPTYHMNGYNFRRSIRNPDSQLREVIRILNTDRCIDRFNFYLETRLHKAGDFRPFMIDRGNVLRVQPGWGTTFWSALKRAGIIVPSDERTDSGYMVYYPGPNFSFFYEMSKFFTETHVERRWHYPEYSGKDIPRGWRIS